MIQPWLKFYPADWRSDPRLRVCSIGARGLWMEMLCIMHEADPYGYLLVNGRAVTVQKLATMAGVPLKECSRLLAELEEAGVYSVEQDVIVSRRMVRDRAKAERDKGNGKAGGNPSLKGGVNPEDKAQKLEARSQKEVPTSSGADAPRDIRADLFGRGLKTLAEITGKTPDSCRSLVGRLLKDVNDEAVHVLGAIDDAARNQVADPVAWITATLKSRRNGGQSAENRSVHAAAGRLVDRIRQFDADLPGGGSEPGTTHVRLLSQG